MNFAWTEQHVDMIAGLLRQGRSASEIARHFPGVSRNAVIGKIGREKRLREIGLTRRPGGQPSKAPVLRSRAKPQPKHPQPEHVTAVELVYVRGIPLLDIGHNECRWPVAGEKAAMIMCGAPIMKGHAFRYCRAHQERARAA